MKTISTTKLLERYKLTEFQEKVLLATTKIPKGQTRTYRQIAEAAGYPKAYRAVGSVMKMNPLAPKLPCHRVVKSDGSTGNYSGKGGPKGKIRILISEGAF